MQNDENQNSTKSQISTNVKIHNENSTIENGFPEELAKNNKKDIYNEIDAIFFEDVAEYTKDACKLITKLKEKYKNEFKNWKYLCTDHVEQGDLVQMRGMILNGMQVEFSLNAVITEDEDGNDRTVCGILRNRIDCSNIKETKDISRRNAYILVPERGITDWYLETFYGKSGERCNEALFKNEESRIYSMFYDEESENFKPNTVLDLYGIIDLAETSVEEDDDGSNVKNPSRMISLHVIHYEPVEYRAIVSSVHPEVLNYTNMQGFDSLIYALEQLLGSKIIAHSLGCQLFISGHSQPPGSVEYTFPYTIKKVYDSQLIIEAIKLFIPKVHVIDVVEGTMEKSWASYEKPQNDFEQGLLQVSDNTLIIIDETKLSPENLLLTKKGRENYHLIKNFLSTRKMPFIYPYQTVEIESNISILVLSGEKCFFGQDGFAMVVSKSCPRDANFVRQYAIEHKSELNLCRHAILSCPKNFRDVKICKAVEGMAVESFLTMQRMCRNVDDNSARLHRQLIISKLLASLMGEKIVDEDCWKKAVVLEKELRLTAEVPSTDN
ncbi:Mini-chromosome maintenance complex-binding protein [Dirofilaria immitis]